MRIKRTWLVVAGVILIAGVAVWLAMPRGAPAEAAGATPADLTAVTEPTAVTPSPDTPEDLLPGPGLSEVPMVNAAGPVPADIYAAAASGDPLGQITKMIWECGGKVIPVGEGQYVVPLPERIPKDFSYPTQHYAAPAAATDVERFVGYPPFLAPGDYDLFAKLMTDGSAAKFDLAQASDGYLHVVTKQ